MWNRFENDRAPCSSRAMECSRPTTWPSATVRKPSDRSACSGRRQRETPSSGSLRLCSPETSEAPPGFTSGSYVWKGTSPHSCVGGGSVWTDLWWTTKCQLWMTIAAESFVRTLAQNQNGRGIFLNWCFTAFSTTLKIFTRLRTSVMTHFINPTRNQLWKWNGFALNSRPSQHTVLSFPSMAQAGVCPEMSCCTICIIQNNMEMHHHRCVSGSVPVLTSMAQQSSCRLCYSCKAKCRLTAKALSSTYCVLNKQFFI